MVIDGLDRILALEPDEPTAEIAPALVALRGGDVLDVMYGDLSDTQALQRFLRSAGC